VITIPITLTMAIWLLVAREWKPAILWCTLFGFANLLVLATKVAFVGWGIGIEALDFTGISGHATRAAMVYPILFYFGLQAAPRRVNGRGVYLGMAVGAMISISRVMVNAHSGSEILAGWLLGTCMCLIFLKVMKTHTVLISRRWLLACSFSLLFISPLMRPFESDDLITDLALYLSGHQVPFTRAVWGHSSHVMHFWH
jgi:membrane-associated phospholipid phosphatase